MIKGWKTNIHIPPNWILWLTEQDNITGITTRKRKTLINMSWMISWEDKQQDTIIMGSQKSEKQSNNCIHMSSDSDTHSIRAGVAGDVQE